MLQILALIKIKDKDSFVEFEKEAIRILQRHGGSLITAFTPDERLSTIHDYDEVHFLEFATLESFNNYKNDKELSELIELKQFGTEKMDLIFSKEHVSYL